MSRHNANYPSLLPTRALERPAKLLTDLNWPLSRIAVRTQDTQGAPDSECAFSILHD